MLARGRSVLTSGAKYSFEDIVGHSVEIRRAIDCAKRYALSEEPVLIYGPTGSGKELFAHAIHRYSNRRLGPFVAVNCAALPETLLESELFGYVAGAFTGAKPQGKRGLLEAAEGGTLFLDELGDLPMPLQGKLLRALDQKEFFKLGSSTARSCDIRLVCATNKDLNDLVVKGRFREDLYYRVSTFVVSIPALKDRPCDIPILIRHFLAQMIQGRDAAFVDDVVAQATMVAVKHSWPGNVRELQAFCRRVALFIKTGGLPKDIRAAVDVPGEAAMTRQIQKLQHAIEMVRKSESELIFSAVTLCGGNKSKAAAMLGVSRSTLWRKIKKLSANLANWSE